MSDTNKPIPGPDYDSVIKGTSAPKPDYDAVLKTSTVPKPDYDAVLKQKSQPPSIPGAGFGTPSGTIGTPSQPMSPSDISGAPNVPPATMPELGLASSILPESVQPYAKAFQQAANQQHAAQVAQQAPQANQQYQSVQNFLNQARQRFSGNMGNMLPTQQASQPVQGGGDELLQSLGITPPNVNPQPAKAKPKNVRELFQGQTLPQMQQTIQQSAQQPQNWEVPGMENHNVAPSFEDASKAFHDQLGVANDYLNKIGPVGQLSAFVKGLFPNTSNNVDAIQKAQSGVGGAMSNLVNPFMLMDMATKGNTVDQVIQAAQDFQNSNSPMEGLSNAVLHNAITGSAVNPNLQFLMPSTVTKDVMGTSAQGMPIVKAQEFDPEAYGEAAGNAFIMAKGGLDGLHAMRGVPKAGPVSETITPPPFPQESVAEPTSVAQNQYLTHDDLLNHVKNSIKEIQDYVVQNAPTPEHAEYWSTPLNVTGMGAFSTAKDAIDTLKDYAKQLKGEARTNAIDSINKVESVNHVGGESGSLSTQRISPEGEPFTVPEEKVIQGVADALTHELKGTPDINGSRSILLSRFMNELQSGQYSAEIFSKIQKLIGEDNPELAKSTNPDELRAIAEQQGKNALDKIMQEGGKSQATTPTPEPQSAPTKPQTNSAPKPYTASNWRQMAQEDIETANHALQNINQRGDLTNEQKRGLAMDLRKVRGQLQDSLDFNEPAPFMIDEMNDAHQASGMDVHDLVKQLVNHQRDVYDIHPDEIPAATDKMYSDLRESGGKVTPDMFSHYEGRIGPEPDIEESPAQENTETHLENGSVIKPEPVSEAEPTESNPTDTTSESITTKPAKPKAEPKPQKPRGGAKALIGMSPDSDVFDPFSDDYDPGIVEAVLNQFGPPDTTYDYHEAGSAASHYLQAAQEAQRDEDLYFEQRANRYDTFGSELKNVLSDPQVMNWGGWHKWSKVYGKSKIGIANKVIWKPTGFIKGVPSNGIDPIVNEMLAEHATRNYGDPEYRLANSEQHKDALNSGNKGTTKIGKKLDRVLSNRDTPPSGSKMVSEVALDDYGGNRHMWPLPLVLDFIKSGDIPMTDPRLEAPTKRRGFTSAETEQAQRYYSKRPNAKITNDLDVNRTTQPSGATSEPVGNNQPTEVRPTSGSDQATTSGRTNAVVENPVGNHSGRENGANEPARSNGSSEPNAKPSTKQLNPDRVAAVAAARQDIQDATNFLARLGSKVSSGVDITEIPEALAHLGKMAKAWVTIGEVHALDLVDKVNDWLKENNLTISKDALNKVLADHDLLHPSESTESAEASQAVTPPPLNENGRPTTTGGSRRVIEEHVAAGALKPIPKGTWDSPQETIKKAQEWVANGGSPDALLDELEQNKRPANGIEVRILEEGDLAKQRAINKAQSEASSTNDPAKKAALQAEVSRLSDDLQQFKERQQKIASQAGNVLAQFQGNREIDTGNFAQVQGAIEKSQGRSLSAPEREQLHQMIEQLKSDDAEHRDNLASLTEKLHQHEQTIRETQAQLELNKSVRETRTKATRASLYDERQKLFKDLARLGSRLSVNPVDEVVSGFVILGKLAKNIAAEGVLSIDDLMSKIKTQLADNKIDFHFTKKDLIDSIIGDNGKEKPAQSEQQKNSADVIKMAKLHDAIDDIWENGNKEAPPKVKQPEHPEVAKLKAEFKEIKKATAPANASLDYVVKNAAETGNSDLNALLEKVKKSYPNATLRDVVESLSPKEGRPNTLTPESANLRDARMQADLTKKIADQEVKTPRKNPLEKPIPDSPEVTRLKGLLDEARKNNPQPKVYKPTGNIVKDTLNTTKVGSFSDLVKEVQAKHPEMSEEDIYNALLEKKASAQESARQVTNRTIRNQAKMTKDIRDLESQLKMGKAAESIKEATKTKDAESQALETRRKNLQSLVRGMTQSQKPTNLAAVLAEGARFIIMANPKAAAHIALAGPATMAMDEAGKIPAGIRNTVNSGLYKVSGGKLGTNQILNAGPNLPDYIRSAATAFKAKDAVKYAWRGQSEAEMRLNQSPDQYYGSHGLQTPANKIRNMIRNPEARTTQNTLKTILELEHSVGTLHGALQQLTAKNPGMMRTVLEQSKLMAHNLSESELQSLSPSLKNLTGKQLRSAAQTYLAENPTTETMQKGLDYGNRIANMSDNNINKLVANVRSSLGKTGETVNEIGGKNNASKLANAGITYAMPVAKPSINQAFINAEYSPLGIARGGFSLLSDSLHNATKNLEPGQKPSASAWSKLSDVLHDTTTKLTTEEKANAQRLFDHGLVGTGMIYLGAQMYLKNMATGSYLGPQDKDRAANAKRAKQNATGIVPSVLDTDKGMGVVPAGGGIGLPLHMFGEPGNALLAGVDFAKQLHDGHPNEAPEALAHRMYESLLNDYNPIKPIMSATDKVKNLFKPKK